LEGKPIIAHVIDMFPGEKDFIFICSDEHLSSPNFHMREILLKYCPTGQIIGIPPHKLGPVHAVLQVEHMLNPTEPVIVNYCDFTCYWDWQHFQEFVSRSQCHGAIPAYKGFHPHTLGNTNYAYMREQNGWVIDIQEKQPYTNNRMEEYASSGTYYFSTGEILRNAFHDIVNNDINVNGEYYVSLAYKPMLQEQLAVAVYPLQHFMQWGTPEDVEEYIGWSEVFKDFSKKNHLYQHPFGTVIIPMAGLGSRFINEGYNETKPLIPVSGQPMVMQAVHDLPLAKQHVYILRQDMNGLNDIVKVIKSRYPDAIIKSIPNVTEGQACTALIGLDALESKMVDFPAPVTFGACDNGAIYNKAEFKRLLDESDVDVIVWGARGHANAVRHPNMFGWINASDNGFIKHISVKAPLKNPASDPIVIGTFTFKRASDFRKSVDRLISRNGRINDEFYLDSCINDAIELGLKCKLFEVDSFLSWGTPDDLRTFEYWQSCFHKWKTHPYKLNCDARIPNDIFIELDERYSKIVPEIPLRSQK